MWHVLDNGEGKILISDGGTIILQVGQHTEITHASRGLSLKMSIGDVAAQLRVGAASPKAPTPLRRVVTKGDVGE